MHQSQINDSTWAYLNVGLGLMRRLTPYSATMKKCMTSREGFGASPDSKLMGPEE